MDYIITKTDGSEALYHHGIKGMHWGVRRYQNEDGTLTEAGKRRYAKYIQKELSKDPSYERKDKLAIDIAKDLEKNSTGSIRNQLNNVKNKKQEWLQYVNKIPVEYYDSEQYQKDYIKAYDETIKWFKKNEPYHMEEISLYTDYSDDPYFNDVLYDHVGPKIFDKAEKEYNKKYDYDEDFSNQLYDNFINESKKATDLIVGKYGNKKVKKTKWYLDGDEYVKDIINKSLRSL